MSSSVQTQPQYVNLQASPVQVYDAGRHPVTVLPWANRRSARGGLYVVEGVHYQQFVSGAGPLYPFPANQDSPPKPLPESDDARHARMVSEARVHAQVMGATPVAQRGRFRGTGDVVREGTVVGETATAHAARLRQGLEAVGIRTRSDFRQAAAPILLRVKGVTQENLPRVREMEASIFPDAAPADATVEGANLAAQEEPSVTTSTDDEDAPAKVSRAKVEAMSLADLRSLVGLRDLSVSKGGSAEDVRERVLTALESRDMLTA